MNRLLQMLANELDVDGALMVLRIFRIPSIGDVNVGGVASAVKDDLSIVIGPSPQPNAQTYNIMTRMFGRLGRGGEALAFFRLALSTCDRQSVDAVSERALQQASASVMKAYLNAGHPFALWPLQQRFCMCLILAVPRARPRHHSISKSLLWQKCRSRRPTLTIASCLNVLRLMDRQMLLEGS